MKKPALIFLVIVPGIGLAVCLAAAGLAVYLAWPDQTFTFEQYIQKHPGTGTVILPEDVIRLGLSHGKTHIHGFLKDGRAQVPAGEWRLDSWQMAREDENGVTWAAMADYRGGAPDVNVPAAGETAVKIGEPFREVLSVWRAGAGYGFDRVLRDVSGASVTITRGRARPVTVLPKLRITNAAGDYDREFEFAYG